MFGVYDARSGITQAISKAGFGRSGLSPSYTRPRSGLEDSTPRLKRREAIARNVLSSRRERCRIGAGKPAKATPGGDQQPRPTTRVASQRVGQPKSALPRRREPQPSTTRGGSFTAMAPAQPRYVNAGSFLNIARQVFDMMDTDLNGSLDRDEILDDVQEQ